MIACKILRGLTIEYQKAESELKIFPNSIGKKSLFEKAKRKLNDHLNLLDCISCNEVYSKFGDDMRGFDKK